MPPHATPPGRGGAGGGTCAPLPAPNGSRVPPAPSPPPPSPAHALFQPLAETSGARSGPRGAGAAGTVAVRREGGGRGEDDGGRFSPLPSPPARLRGGRVTHVRAPPRAVVRSLPRRLSPCLPAGGGARAACGAGTRAVVIGAAGRGGGRGSGSGRAPQSVSSLKMAGAAAIAAATPVYCVCREPYDVSRFMIECDICKDWFHGR